MNRYFICGALSIAATVIPSSVAWAGPEWVEASVGDAQSLPPGQKVTGTGKPGTPVTRITGRLGDPDEPPSPLGGAPAVDLEDMYLIEIDDPDIFFASTMTFWGGSAEFNTRLWLFKIDGTGLLANDDSFEPDIGINVAGFLVDESFIGNSANDPDDAEVTEAGQYLLAITTSDSNPFSDGGPIFFFDPEFSGEVSSPDGAGGGQPIAVWDYTPPIDVGFVGPPAIGGNYEIALSGVVAVEGVTTLQMDIKAGSCPNNFNPTSNGVLEVSLLGTDTFDVHDINRESVVISRADGEGGSTGPNEGPPGPHSQYKDKGVPFIGEDCDCHSLELDGFTDLVMKFRSDDVANELALNELPAGALVRLKVSGLFNDDTEFEAFDCVRLVPPGTPPGQATVKSSVNGSWINVEPLDLQLDGGGFATFQRTYPQTTVVTLNAPPIPNHTFLGWKVNDGGTLKVGPTFIYTIAGSTQSIEAVYQPISTSTK